MKRFFSSIALFFLMLVVVLAQEVRPTKNLIVMIPDGTSQSVLSAARWLKVYKNEGTRLHIDPYLSGSVTTFSLNAPIGDSAPTTSCYMTGVPQRAGNISIYPEIDPENDIVKLNPDSTFQPLATILEAMKMEQGKAAGIIATCEFPHATPADCAAHHYNRSKYEFLAPQMAFNNVDVVFGGGTLFVNSSMQEHFQNNGTAYFQNDKKAMMSFDGNKVWALFGERAMPYDIDRNPETTPSISEMTEKAIEILNKNENGFFLMVEGSKIDWVAHANDAAGMIYEYLAFDEAVGKAIEFAKKDGNTTVVIMPDHSNSGFSIGRNGLHKGYEKLTMEELFGQVSKIKRTAEGLEKILLQTKPDDFEEVFEKYTGIELSEEELETLKSSKNYKAEDYTKAATAKNMTNNIITLLNSKMPFGFTTYGHTGEEVFLAVYHPQGDILKGNVRNTEVHDYLYAVTGLEKPMKQLTGEIYAKHTDVFDGFKYSIEGDEKFPKLVVKNKRKKLEVNAFTSVAYLNGKPFDLGSVVVYIDKNNTFYLPKNLVEKIK